MTVAPMTGTDERIAAIEARHVASHEYGFPDSCGHCRWSWPCDTAIVLTRLREVETERNGFGDNVQYLESRLHEVMK